METYIFHTIFSPLYFLYNEFLGQL